MRALCLIRRSLLYKREVFVSGLEAAGYKVADSIDRPRPEDILVIWNRYGPSDEAARRFESAGARVIVCENGYLGKHWMGGTWTAMSLNHHCGAGTWRVGDPTRWDSLNIKLEPFRTGGKELLILAQRGIGEVGVASPSGWAQQVQVRYGGRIRQHPGNSEPKIPLEDDLLNVSAVATWHSGAALKALILGVPVWYEFPQWIGGLAGTWLQLYGTVPVNRNESSRLHMFQRLIWAQWELGEIANGTAFRWLLEHDVVPEAA